MSTSNVAKAPPADDGISLSTTVTVLLAGGMLLALAGPMTHRCCGAPRSLQLQFEERQAAIEQVVAAEERPGPSGNR